MASGFLRQSTAPHRWLTAAQAVWVVYAVVSLSIHLWLIPYRWSQTSIPGWPGWSQDDSLRALAALHIAPGAIVNLNHWLDFATPLVYLGVAAVVFWKRSTEPAGLLWAAVLVLFFAPFSTLGEAYPYLKPLGDANNALGSALFFAALFTFPNGRFTPRWTRWVTLAMALIQVWRLFQADLYQQYFPPLLIGFYLAIPIAQFQRYTRFSTPSQRQQIKWVVFGLAVTTVPLVLFLLVFVTTPALQQPSAAGMAFFLIGNLLWLAFAWALPITVLVAIVRSKLWDIDLVIRRTLVYSLVTVLLVLVYFGGVTLLQSLFTAVTGQSSPAAVVISTLLIAALFNPLRQRLQNLIDQRFYRQKYDAGRTLAQFAAAVRAESDLGQLSSQLTAVIRDTCQPQTFNLWIRPEETMHRES